MSASKKEQIIAKLEEIIRTIIAGNPVGSDIFSNTVSYVDRQYFAFYEEDVATHPKPWVIINNNGEFFKPLPSARYDNTILISVVGFVEATKDNLNLDSIMNSLQKDILLAILNDETLAGLATWSTVREIQTVGQMVYPHGGFSISLEVNYSFIGINL